MIGYVGAVGSAGRFEGALEAWATNRRTPTINTTANPASRSPRRVRFTTFLRCFSLINILPAGIRGWRFLDRRSESRRAAVLGGDNDAVVERAHRVIRRNAPRGVPHPRGIGQRGCAPANRPPPRYLLAVRPSHSHGRSVLIRDALTRLGSKDL